jgi:hypothetical protein
MTKVVAAPGTSNPADELHRLKMMQEMQKELTDWAKSRLAVVSAAVAVLGFFGLKTVVEQSVTNLVDNPVKVQIEKLQAVRDEAMTIKANLVMVNESSKLATEEANKAAAKGKEAQQQVVSALAELQPEIDRANARVSELQPQINRANDAVTDVEQRLQRVRKETDNASRNISGLSQELFDRSRELSLGGTQTEDQIGVFEKKQHELAVAFQEMARADPRLAQQASTLMARFQEIDRQYKDSIARIGKRNAANVILMVGKGDAAEKSAHQTEKYLQERGYFATVYYPYGKSKKDRVEDFEKDFAGLRAGGLKGGPVIFINGRLADRGFYETDLKAAFDANSIPVTQVMQTTFSPSEQYLRKGEDGSFEPENVIVCYFPVSDTPG